MFTAAAVLRRRLHRVGDRQSHFHQLWLLYLGYGVLGGCGLGIGYISPVSTLIKWFPDRPGMATGMAIMGFGGGALIAAPLSRHADGALQDRDLQRRARDLRHHGRHLLHVHDDRGVLRAGARSRLEAGWMDRRPRNRSRW